jgi:hypothetical protein
MHIILERWKKYIEHLDEDEEAHFPWHASLKNAHSLEHVHEILQSSGKFEPMGRGAFRAVFRPIGDDSVVIKAVVDPKHIYMNKADVDLSKQYPSIVPKTYSNAKDFSWISMEAVHTFHMHKQNYEQMMDRLVSVNFPKLQKYILETPGLMKIFRKLFTGKADSLNSEKVFKFIAMSLHAADDHLFPSEYHRADAGAPRYSDGKTMPKMVLALKLIFDFAMNNSAIYFELFKAMSVGGMDPRDFKPRNLGLDDAGRLKIIDTSVFEGIE